MVTEPPLMVSVIVTSTVEEGTNAAKTSNPHVQMSTNDLFQSYVIHVMMFQIMKLCVRRVRTDVERGASTVTNVIVTSIVKVATDAVQTFRRYARMSTDSVDVNYVFGRMMFQIMLLCVHRVGADVETDIMVGVAVIDTAENITYVVQTSRRHVQMSINSSFPNYVTQRMMFRTIRLNASRVWADVVIGAWFLISAIAALTAEKPLDPAVKTTR